MNHCLYFLVVLLLLAACSPAPAVPVVEPTAATTPSNSTTAPLPTLLAIPAASPESPQTAQPVPAASTVPSPGLCSPLQALPLDQLPGLVSNPYHPPAPGSDDPHQGVDFGIRLPGSDVAVSGHPVQAALAGIVAGVIRDRFPYGNALLVETPIEEAPATWQSSAEIPTPAPTLEGPFALTCPAATLPDFDPSRRSLYVMYAHLRDPVSLNPGDPVSCGQAIGAVGSTGNALNPHLHVEIRVGPAGLRFTSLAHYDNSATSEEMSNYCLWRTSGLFQLTDPLRLFALSPEE